VQDDRKIRLGESGAGGGASKVGEASRKGSRVNERMQKKGYVAEGIWTSPGRGAGRGKDVPKTDVPQAERASDRDDKSEKTRRRHEKKRSLKKEGGEKR